MRVQLLLLLVVLLAFTWLGCSHKNSVATTTGKAEPQATLTAADFEQLMQKIGPTYQSLQKSLKENAAEPAAKEAQQLGDLFGGAEKFWTQHNRADAIKFSQQARTYATEAAGAAAAGDVAKATTIASNMGGTCKQCHGAYRESDGQGGYRIKPGVLTQ